MEETRGKRHAPIAAETGLAWWAKGGAGGEGVLVETRQMLDWGNFTFIVWCGCRAAAYVGMTFHYIFTIPSLLFVLFHHYMTAPPPAGLARLALPLPHAKGKHKLPYLERSNNLP